MMFFSLKKRFSVALLLIVGSMFFLFSFNSVSAVNQDLVFEIEASYSEFSGNPSISLKTRKDAISGFNEVDEDQKAPDQPTDPFFVFRSVAGLTEVAIDIWDAEKDPNREIELRFYVFPSNHRNGLINLSWDRNLLSGGPGEEYFFTLVELNNNKNPIGSSINMNEQNYATFNMGGAEVKYFRIETNYQYCGDGIFYNWKKCEPTLSDPFDGQQCSSFGFQGPGNLECNPQTCEIIDDGCFTCGNGITYDGGNDGLSAARCDFINGNPIFPNGKNTCQSWGFVDGTISCTGNCFIDASQCINQDGSSGPSLPGAGGGLGGLPGLPGDDCVNECVLGERRSVSNDSYQVCGLFGSHSCTIWGNVEQCLAVNPFSRNGFCFECLENNHCESGAVCVQGNCRFPEDLTCEDLDLQCGTRFIGGVLLECGSCDDGMFCSGGACSVSPEGAIQLSDQDCTPNFVCSPWSECKVSFTSENLLAGREWFLGTQERICFDENSCYSTTRERMDCSLKIETEIKETEICDIKYIEIYNKNTGELLARTRDLRYQLSRTIEIFLLPGEIDCEEEEFPFRVTWLDKIMFYSDLRNIWRLFL